MKEANDKLIIAVLLQLDALVDIARHGGADRKGQEIMSEMVEIISEAIKKVHKLIT